MSQCESSRSWDAFHEAYLGRAADLLDAATPALDTEFSPKCYKPWKSGYENEYHYQDDQ